MTSKRENIMARLAVILTGITVAHGYHTEVKTVERWIRAPKLDDLDFTDFPLCIVEEGDEVVDYEPGRNSIGTISCKVNLYLAGTGGAMASPTNLNAFIEDARRAIEADHTTNGVAIDVIVKGVSPSVAVNLPYAMASLTLDAAYEAATTAP